MENIAVQMIQRRRHEDIFYTVYLSHWIQKKINIEELSISLRFINQAKKWRSCFMSYESCLQAPLGIFSSLKDKNFPKYQGLYTARKLYATTRNSLRSVLRSFKSRSPYRYRGGEARNWHVSCLCSRLPPNWYFVTPPSPWWRHIRDMAFRKHIPRKIRASP